MKFKLGPSTICQMEVVQKVKHRAQTAPAHSSEGQHGFLFDIYFAQKSAAAHVMSHFRSRFIDRGKLELHPGFGLHGRFSVCRCLAGLARRNSTHCACAHAFGFSGGSAGALQRKSAIGRRVWIVRARWPGVTPEKDRSAAGKAQSQGFAASDPAALGISSPLSAQGFCA